MAKPINFFRSLFPAAGGGSLFKLRRAKYNAESNINEVEEFTAESTRSGVPVPAPPNTDGTYSYSTSENYGLNPNGVVDYPIENRVKRTITASDTRTTNNNPGTPPSGFTTTSRLEFDYNYEITERASYTDYTPILSGQNGLEVVRRDVKSEAIVLSASVVGSNISGYEYSSLPTIQIRVLPGQPSNLTEGGSQTFIELYADRVLTANLTVNITISGTASSGDYAVSNNLLGTGNNRTLVMSAGNSSQTFGLIAAQDVISETIETVIFTLTSSSDYLIGTNSSTTVNIFDAEFTLAFKFNPNGAIGLAGTVTQPPFTITNRDASARLRIYTNPGSSVNRDILTKLKVSLSLDGTITSTSVLPTGAGRYPDADFDGNTTDDNEITWFRLVDGGINDGYYREFRWAITSYLAAGIRPAVTGFIRFEFLLDPPSSPTYPNSQLTAPSDTYQSPSTYLLPSDPILTININIPQSNV